MVLIVLLTINSISLPLSAPILSSNSSSVRAANDSKGSFPYLSVGTSLENMLSTNYSNINSFVLGNNVSSHHTQSLLRTSLENAFNSGQPTAIIFYHVQLTRASVYNEMLRSLNSSEIPLAIQLAYAVNGNKSNLKLDPSVYNARS